MRTQLPGFEHALDTFRRAALEVPAYEDFLRRNGVVAELVQTPQEFARAAARNPLGGWEGKALNNTNNNQ